MDGSKLRQNERKNEKLMEKKKSTERFLAGCFLIPAIAFNQSALQSKAQSALRVHKSRDVISVNQLLVSQSEGVEGGHEYNEHTEERERERRREEEGEREGRERERCEWSLVSHGSVMGQRNSTHQEREKEIRTHTQTVASIPRVNGE